MSIPEIIMYYLSHFFINCQNLIPIPIFHQEFNEYEIHTKPSGPARVWLTLAVGDQINTRILRSMTIIKVIMILNTRYTISV